MVATGTGIAPFISMIKAYQDLSDLILIHGARRKEDFLFSEIFMSCLGKNYHRCASQDQSEGLYPGRLTAFLEVEKLNLQSHFLLCGSPEMVVSSREILINRGIKHENILSEIYF
jgi:ferredoxin--NADP+ reductase